MKLVKVQDHPDLVKDMDSKAVLNNNYAALLEYKNQQRMVNEVDSLKTDVQEIKIIMNKVLELLNK